jgi:hypothetical protein
MMTPRQLLVGLAPRPLAESAIHLIYEIDGLNHAQPALPTLGGIAGSRAAEKDSVQSVPEDQIAALAGRYAAEPIWQRHDAASQGPDFHDHIGRLLTGKTASLSSLWRLAPQAKRLIATADLYEDNTDPKLRSKKHLVLGLSAAAAKRLSAAGIDPSALRVSVDDVALLLFNTGHGFACVEVTLKRDTDDQPLSTMELLEAQIALGRFNQLNWKPARKDAAPAADAKSAGNGGFSLGGLMRLLALGPSARTRRAGRVFTYTFARLQDPAPVAARDALGLYLARHYSSAYEVSAEIDSVRKVADFDTIRHSFALEGAATVVGVDPSSPEPAAFLEAFHATTFRSHYIGAALLALHEHGFLVDRTTRAVDASAGSDNVATMSALRRESLLFRTQFRFADISYISRHNAAWHALRDVFGCQEMLRQLNDDVTEMSAVLSTEQQQRHADEEHATRSKTYWATVLGSASLAALTAYTIVKEGLVAFPALKKIVEGAGITGAQTAFLTAVLVFFGSCWLSWTYRPRQSRGHDEHAHDDSEHFRAHAAAKTVLKAAGTAEKA